MPPRDCSVIVSTPLKENMITEPNKSKIADYFRKPWRVYRKIIIGAILVGIITLVIRFFGESFLTYLTDSLIEKRYIAVVMSETDNTFTIPKEFKKGFGNEQSIKTINGEFVAIENKDDQYSVDQAKIVADKLVSDVNCVMIIGNSNSELTEVTLNSILNRKEGKTAPAFLLPIATADNLISKSHSEHYSSILRMVPDNDNQALVVARFLYNKFKSNARIAILVDEDNITYSHNLSKNIASAVISQDAIIVLNQAYGNNQRFINSYEVVRRNKVEPDVIIYVGVSSNGMLLIEELKAFGIKSPVIFTDGSTVEELMRKAKNLLGSSAYFLSPVTLDQEKGNKPTYEPIGKDAFNLATLILNGIDGKISRESVSKHVAANKEKIILSNGEAGDYGFSPDGNNKKMDFKIYHYEGDSLILLPGLK